MVTVASQANPDVIILLSILHSLQLGYAQTYSEDAHVYRLGPRGAYVAYAYKRAVSLGAVMYAPQPLCMR